MYNDLRDDLLDTDPDILEAEADLLLDGLDDEDLNLDDELLPKKKAGDDDDDEELDNDISDDLDPDDSYDLFLSGIEPEEDEDLL